MRGLTENECAILDRERRRLAQEDRRRSEELMERVRMDVRERGG